MVEAVHNVTFWLSLLLNLSGCQRLVQFQTICILHYPTLGLRCNSGRSRFSSVRISFLWSQMIENQKLFHLHVAFFRYCDAFQPKSSMNERDLDCVYSWLLWLLMWLPVRLLTSVTPCNGFMKQTVSRHPAFYTSSGNLFMQSYFGIYKIKYSFIFDIF